MNVSHTMMGFPALSDILANEPASEPDPAKQTLFGFPAQKAGMSPFAKQAISEDEESEAEYDEGDATHLIPADQLQREFEINSPVVAAVEAHEPRMTMAGIPVSELSASPASIKSAWGLDEESESDSTSVVPASAIFDKEQSAKAGFSKRVETTEFPGSSTLMGMSVDDFNATLNPPAAEPDDSAVHSTQFAMPAIQAVEPAAAKPAAAKPPREFDSGPASVELPTQMWNPSDELDEDNAQHRELLQKIRGDAAEKHGEPRAAADRGTAEHAKPQSVGPALGLAAGKAPAIPAPKSSGLGDTSSLRSRLQERLKGAVPEPLPKPAVIVAPAVIPAPVMAAPVISTPDPADIEPADIEPADIEPADINQDLTALESSELPEISVESIVPMASISARPEAAKEPRSLSSSGVLGGGTYVVSKKEEAPAQPIFPKESTVAAPEDDEDFAFADTSIARPDALPAGIADAPAASDFAGSSEVHDPGRPSTPTIGGMPPAVVRTPTPLPAQQPAAPQPTTPQPATQQSTAPQSTVPTGPALAPSLGSIPDAVNAIEPLSAEPGAQAPESDMLVTRLQQLFGFIGFLLVAVSAGLNMIVGVGGILLVFVFGAFALALMAITFVPFDATAKNVAWTFLGVIVVAAAAAVLVFDLIHPIAGALAIGGGMAALFAGFAGVVLNKILR